ncbi:MULTISPECIES: type III PLP-dependent enzyme [unclassified Marinovum]
MQFDPAPFADPVTMAARLAPDLPVACFCPRALGAQARRFRRGFPGLVTYAVKANPTPEVLETLVAAGIRAFDVASVGEMRAVRAACAKAVLHYHNPVRSTAEIATARSVGVAAWSVDSLSELAKIAPGPGDEIAVRLALKVPGAAYDFGTKFGVGPVAVAELLRAVVATGARPSITFHPGTQCGSAQTWGVYIKTAAEVAQAAGVTLHRLNVGGGFAAHRDGTAPDLEAVFAEISRATSAAFATPPALVCEPGRAMASEAVTLVTRIKAMRDDGAVFLNDGLYGGLAEMRDMAVPGRFSVTAPDGTPRKGPPHARRVFGPTCDSVDKLPGEVALPKDCAEGDFVFWPGMGAYGLTLSTGFNGYGVSRIVTVKSPLPVSGQSG